MDLTVESTARDQAAAVRARSISARELLDLHLDRIGERNPQLLQRVSLALLREHGDPDETYAVGDVVQFPAPDSQGTFAGVVRELAPPGEDWALFDFNHPLAGQPLSFEVHVIGVL